MENYVSEETEIIQKVQDVLELKIVGYEEIIKLIVKIINAGLVKPELKKINLLLTGEKSTGKTAIFDAMMEGLGIDNCIKYDASMATRVGLLDHLYSFANTNSENITLSKYIVFDEIDKMSKTNQYGILNCVEAGIMRETKYRRHRQVDVRGSTFFGTSNEINLVYSPLRSRFLVLDMPKYTEQQFELIGTTLLSRMEIDHNLVQKIMQVVNVELPDKTIRDVVRLGTLVNTVEDVEDMTQVLRKHRLNFD